MLRSRYTEEQIVTALRQAEAGTPVAEICRKLEVTEGTFYRWKKHFGGLGVKRVARAAAATGGKPEAQAAGRGPEPGQADLAGVAPKKMVTLAQRRAWVAWVREAFQLSTSAACRATGVHRSLARYRSRQPPQDALRARLRELAAARVSYGSPRLWVLLPREGWQVNHKRVERLYRQEGLQLGPRRPRRRRSAVARGPRVAAQAPNQIWAMDLCTTRCWTAACCAS